MLVHNRPCYLVFGKVRNYNVCGETDSGKIYPREENVHWILEACPGRASCYLISKKMRNCNICGEGIEKTVDMCHCFSTCNCVYDAYQGVFNTRLKDGEGVSSSILWFQSFSEIHESSVSEPTIVALEHLYIPNWIQEDYGTELPI